MGSMTGVLFISNVWFCPKTKGDFQELGVSLNFRNVVGMIQEINLSLPLG